MSLKKRMTDPDFSGYATKVGIKCTDGRTIVKDAFKDCDGLTVPLVYMHLHSDPKNVLGHAVLENREDGVYAYAKFNETEAGKNAKLLVQHGDIRHLSIYANQLKEQAKHVIHGVIREVSLVLAGANPGAVIDNLSIAHNDGSPDDVSEEEAIIYTDSKLSLSHEDGEDGETVQDVFDTLTEKQKTAVYALIGSMSQDDMEHADGKSEEDMTVQEVFDTLSEIQKTAVYALIAEIQKESGEDVQHSDEGDSKLMKKNVFDKEDAVEKYTLTHDDFKQILGDAQACGSFREAFLAHTQEYGIENIDYLFPDAKTLTNTPDMIARRMEWVSAFMGGTRHTPFSRIKSVHADITADEARAKGYIKGTLKKDEVITLLKRVTTPSTIYKKQKLDRDDVIDITDLDVISWMKAEMRVMLDEEIARACLISDGRASDDEDKISETNIRPIYKDADLYAHKVRLAADLEPDEIVDEMIRARKEYKGSGNPVLFTTTDIVNDMLLCKDTTGHRIYKTMAELEATLRVSKIVEVEVMESITRQSTDSTPVTLNLLGIMVNLNDYTIGADKGGGINMFDDFDIDYNQYKYLIETRISGALTKPKSALIFEQVASAG